MFDVPYGLDLMNVVNTRTYLINSRLILTMRSTHSWSPKLAQSFSLLSMILH